uniref:Uncharacterized protein n=1 Tax=Globodera rostochiensis TaxID=31243 RepID=A0A914H9B0_GLORO
MLPNPHEFRIRVNDIRIYVKTVDVAQSLNNAISNHLEITPAKYPMRKIEIRSLFLPEGTSDLSHNVFTSVIPRRWLVLLCNTNDFYP